MFKLVLVSTLLAVASGLEIDIDVELPFFLPKLDGYIEGGIETTIDKVPWQISLAIEGGSSFCGGAVISETFVLTAAHCVYGVPASAFSIRAGSTQKDSGGVVRNVFKCDIHPLYDSSTMDYDIGCLQLNTPLSLSKFINVVNLPSRNEIVETGKDAVCTGWSEIPILSSVTANLQTVTVQILSNEVCSQIYGARSITERMICAGNNEGGKNVCQGESGGPLVVDGELVGVVSWGIGCADSKYPGVYTDVANLRDFITEVIGI